jgi:hypothetical protein
MNILGKKDKDFFLTEFGESGRSNATDRMIMVIQKAIVWRNRQKLFT